MGKADRPVVEILNMQNPTKENSFKKIPEVSYPGLPKLINFVFYTKPWGDSHKLIALNDHLHCSPYQPNLPLFLASHLYFGIFIFPNTLENLSDPRNFHFPLLHAVSVTKFCGQFFGSLKSPPLQPVPSL